MTLIYLIGKLKIPQWQKIAAGLAILALLFSWYLAQKAIIDFFHTFETQNKWLYVFVLQILQYKLLACSANINKQK